MADRDVQWPLSARAPNQDARKFAYVVAPPKHTSGRCDSAIRCRTDEGRDMHEAGCGLYPCRHSAAPYRVAQIPQHPVGLCLWNERVNGGEGLFHGQSRMRAFGGKYDQQSLTQRRIERVDDMNLARRINPLCRGTGCLIGAARRGRQVNGQDILEMARKKLELAAKIAWCRLRRCRVYWIRCKLREKLGGRDTDLVEVTPVAELQAARDHVNIEAFEVFVGDVGSRICNYGEPARGVVTAVRLPVHVVGLFSTNRAVFTTNIEHVFGIVNVNVNLGFALGSGQQQRITDFGQGFTQLAPVDVGAAHNTLGAVTKFRVLAGSGHSDL